MSLLVWRLRLWRRVRRHYLSMEEMSMLSDLTVPEVVLMLAVSERAGKK